MIIKSLELHNFRQFMDDEDKHGQKIVFSIDPEKKATILIAKNATGKTTLLQAFSWILYGEATGLKSIIQLCSRLSLGFCMEKQRGSRVSSMLI